MRFSLFTIFALMIMQKCYSEDFEYSIDKLPTVGISVLVSNKEPYLPYFLSGIYKLYYPRDRMYLWFYLDYSEDNSATIIQEWLDTFGDEYYEVHFIKKDTPPMYDDQKHYGQWSPKRYKHVMELREEALKFARKRWVNYLFMIDADVILTNIFTLKSLIDKELDVVAPMLNSDRLYTNFWSSINKATYFFEMTESYTPIMKREKVGCIKVPMIHTAVLINLTKRKSDHLTYNSSNVLHYKGTDEDYLVFALKAEQVGISLHICNDDVYGYLSIPLEEGQNPVEDAYHLDKLKFKALSDGHSFPLMEYFLEKSIVKYPTKSKLSCDEIFMINLEKRRERRYKMEEAFKYLGIDATLFKAIDGKSFSKEKPKFMNLMPHYRDPYHMRPMKSGEVGCFLSHYYIWEKIVDKHLQVTLILEDDLDFSTNFREKLHVVMQELKHLDWDLCYIGRKIMSEEDEVRVTQHIVKPQYSYWTLGYLITERGAQKLLKAKPLKNVLPVDEFLPIMYDQHPNEQWKSYFPNRNLNAYSASPLIVYPTHYTGDKGYVSDTEASDVLQWASKEEL